MSVFVEKTSNIYKMTPQEHNQLISPRQYHQNLQKTAKHIENVEKLRSKTHCNQTLVKRKN